MGSSAWIINLEPISGLSQGDPEAVKNAFHGVMRSEWRTELGPLGRGAVQWIDYDEVLWVELGDNVLKVWTLYGDWPMELAEHWVELVLALGRHSFDRELYKLGYRFAQRPDERPLPSLKSTVHSPSTRVFFVEGGAVCQLIDDTIYEQLKLDGSATREKRPLPAQEQARIRAAIASRRCECPYCKNTRDNFGNYRREVWHGATVEAAWWWPANAEFIYTIVNETTLRATIPESDVAYEGFGERWRRVSTEPLTFPPQKVLTGTHAMCVFGTEGKNAVIKRSTDGGATFTVVRNTDDTREYRAVYAHPDGRFYASASQCENLIMSSDEGATWIEICDLEATCIIRDPSHPHALFVAYFERLHRLVPP